MGYSPWGYKELDMAEVTEHIHKHTTNQTLTEEIWLETYLERSLLYRRWKQDQSTTEACITHLSESVKSVSALALWVQTKAMYELLIKPFYFLNCT